MIVPTVEAGLAIRNCLCSLSDDVCICGGNSLIDNIGAFDRRIYIFYDGRGEAKELFFNIAVIPRYGAELWLDYAPETNSGHIFQIRRFRLKDIFHIFIFFSNFLNKGIS